MARQRQQRDERYPMVWYDQHRRAWDTHFDTQSRSTTGCHSAHGWSAPVMPPQPYMQEDIRTPGRFVIDYRRWIADLTQRHREFDNFRRTWAMALSKPMDDAMVLFHCGAAPYPLDLVKACRAGNKWVLGLLPIDRVPPWAEPYRLVWEPEPMNDQAYEDVEDGYADLEGDLAAGMTDPLDETENLQKPEPGDLDRFSDEEEEHDPDAVGGKRLPVPRGGRRDAQTA